MLAVTIAVLLVFTAALWAKEQPPEPEKMKKLSFPSFKEFKMKNNIEVVVVEHHEQPVVTAAVVIRAGGVLDPWEKIGLSGFVAELLNKGTKDKTSDELARWIESVGGDVGIFSADDYVYVTVSILSEYLDTAYQYLTEILMNPIFPEDELETHRKRIITALEIELSQPRAVVNRQFTEIIYRDHPYAKAPTPETVKAISREDLVEFHKRNFVANNALIAVVGDVKTKQVKKALEKHFSSWKQGEPEVAEYTPAPDRTSKQIYLFHRPGSVQTEYRVGHLGLRAKDPDWPAVVVGNRVLGGGADARIFMNLREDKGWTYGAYSSYSRSPDLGSFSTWASVGTDVTDSALVELMGELERISSESVTEEELNNAKAYLIGNFPNTIETPNQIAGQIIQVKQLGLGKDHLEKYRDRLAKVTVEDVARVMKKHLRPDNVAIVLVGDAKEIKDKVENALTAKVALYDIEGEPLSMEAMAVKPVDYKYETSLLKDMTATYSLNVQTMALGDLSVNLKNASREGKDVIEVSAKLAGMINMDQKMVLSAEDLSPISYMNRFMAGPTQMSADLEFEGGKGVGTVKGPKAEEPKEITVKMIKGAILDDSVEFALAVLPLELAKKYRFPVVDTKSGTLQNVDIEVLEEIKLDVPAGAFDTYKLKFKTPDGEYFVYCKKAMPHLLIKQEVPAQAMSLELKSLVK